MKRLPFFEILQPSYFMPERFLSSKWFEQIRHVTNFDQLNLTSKWYIWSFYCRLQSFLILIFTGLSPLVFDRRVITPSVTRTPVNIQIYNRVDFMQIFTVRKVFAYSSVTVTVISITSAFSMFPFTLKRCEWFQQKGLSCWIFIKRLFKDLYILIKIICQKT